ncbi:MAG: uroporphyrinogen decarboxylase family protein, partial [Planctomycetota bacterium]
AQFEAGCQVVQLFDSWAGALGPADYEAFVLPHLRRVIEAVEPYGPVINFMTGNPALLPLCASAGGAAVGLDWRVDLAAGWEAVGHDRAVQGNLDPIALLSDPKTLQAKVKTILDAAGGRPGHLFNLGHGILPETDPALAKALVDMVHEEGTRPRG